MLEELENWGLIYLLDIAELLEKRCWVFVDEVAVVFGVVGCTSALESGSSVLGLEKPFDGLSYFLLMVTTAFLWLIVDTCYFRYSLN